MNVNINYILSAMLQKDGKPAKIESYFLEMCGNYCISIKKKIKKKLLFSLKLARCTFLQSSSFFLTWDRLSRNYTCRVVIVVWNAALPNHAPRCATRSLLRVSRGQNGASSTSHQTPMEKNKARDRQERKRRK